MLFLAKLLSLLKNIRVKNATTSTTPSTNTGLGNGFTRDPKATEVKHIGYAVINGSGGTGRDTFESSSVDLSVLKSAVKNDSYLQQAQLKYSELLFKSGYIFQSKNQQALQYLKLRLDMMGVATGIPTDQLIRDIGQDFVEYHNVFVVKARAKNGQGLPPGMNLTAMLPAKYPVAGYFVLDPTTIQIKRDESGNIKKYQQLTSGSSQGKTFNPEDIIHFTYNVPSGEAFGYPWLASVIEDVRLLRKIEENAALLLYRHIFPLLTYTIGTTEPGQQATDEELEEFQSTVEDMPTDGALVLPERHKVEAVDIKPIDGRPYLDYFENRVFTGTGLSQVDFGRGNTANRSTADAMTGAKTDRIKGWQESLMVQIDHFMIEELLVEGGFDPLINPDFRVNFIFNEIELEKKIAKETHEVFKWNNNIQSFDETRNNIGLEPEVDEKRLHFNMVGTTDTSNEADNKNQPENQSGQRDGPKSATEQVRTIHRSYAESKTPALKTVKSVRSTSVKEPASVVQSTIPNHRPLFDDLNAIYESIRQSTLDRVKLNRDQFPISTPKLTYLHFGKDQIQALTQSYILQSFNLGVENSDQHCGPIRVNSALAQQTLYDYSRSYLDDVTQRVSLVIKNRFNQLSNIEEALNCVQSAFDANSYKLKSFSKDMMSRSYNYGFALGLLAQGIEDAVIDADRHCIKCKEHQGKLHLSQWDSLDQIAVFYKIPPWHPNCRCELRVCAGGET